MFSNESGLGSAAIAHAAAQTNSPVRQGVIAMLGTFIDTIVVCTMTALVILTSGAWVMKGADGAGLTGVLLTSAGFQSTIAGGSYIVTIALAVFAFTTILGWSYYGERCWQYLLSENSLMVYRGLWVLAALGFANVKVAFVWNLSDTLNGLMAVPNLIGLLLLAPMVFKVTRNARVFRRLEASPTRGRSCGFEIARESGPVAMRARIYVGAAREWPLCYGPNLTRFEGRICHKDHMMKKREKLFSHSGNGACLTYQKVQEAGHERYESVRAQCEDLWCDFSEHADRHFRQEFAKNFHQRWFEMYLTVSLIRAGLVVECLKPGPDILVTADGRRIWIEAVCLTGGEAGKPNSVPELKFGTVQNVPIEQYVMRIRNSLNEKANKFRKYIADGIVHRYDYTVIAINGGEIPFWVADVAKCMERSLYGVGDMVFKFDRDSRKIVNAERENIQAIQKASGAKIGVQPFADGSMKHVSYALASWANAFNLPSSLGGDYVLYPNLSSTTPWVGDLLPVVQEWSFRETQEGWSGEKIVRR